MTESLFGKKIFSLSNLTKLGGGKFDLKKFSFFHDEFFSAPTPMKKIRPPKKIIFEKILCSQIDQIGLEQIFDFFLSPPQKNKTCLKINSELDH